jgi:hypothetical protein
VPSVHDLRNTDDASVDELIVKRSDALTIEVYESLISATCHCPFELMISIIVDLIMAVCKVERNPGQKGNGINEGFRNQE